MHHAVIMKHMFLFPSTYVCRCGVCVCACVRACVCARTHARTAVLQCHCTDAFTSNWQCLNVLTTLCAHDAQAFHHHFVQSPAVCGALRLLIRLLAIMLVNYSAGYATILPVHMCDWDSASPMNYGLAHRHTWLGANFEL